MVTASSALQEALEGQSKQWGHGRNQQPRNTPEMEHFHGRSMKDTGGLGQGRDLYDHRPRNWSSNEKTGVRTGGRTRKNGQENKIIK